MLKHAFKEWAVICGALAAGRQALILRKGGVAESADEFRPEHLRFWLFPTYTHQQHAGVRPEAAELLEQAEAGRPPAGVVKLGAFAEVGGIYHVRNLAAALMLEPFHFWSETTVRTRFAYRTPGLYVLPVRVYRLPEPFELPALPSYEGCRSWVELDRELPTEGAVPVLGDEAFRELMRGLDLLLNPVALA